MKKYFLSAFVLLFSLPVAFGAPGDSYDILGDSDFTSPNPGGSFTAATFDLIAQVLDKTDGKFYWESSVAIGSSGGHVYLRDRTNPNVNVAIGDLTTPDAKLHIKGDDALETSAALYVYNSTQTQGNPSLAVKNDGKVGIGTASPTGILHVENASAVSGQGMGIILRAQDSTDAAGGNVVIESGDTIAPLTDAGYISIKTGKFSSPGQDSVFGNIFLLPEPLVGSGTFGKVGIGLEETSTLGARLHIKSDKSSSSTSALKIDNSNDTNLMIIKNDGNVGIGVTDPDATLEINGQIKITGGSPGVDKVLTSGADGLASWQAPSAGHWEQDSTKSDMLTVNDTNYRKLGNNGTQFLYMPDLSGTIVLGDNGTDLTTGATDNTIIGMGSGSTMTTESGNVLIGSNVQTYGDGNILIGSGVSNGDANGSRLNIGNVIYGKFIDNPSFRAIGIGNSNPSATLDINTTSGHNGLRIQDATGANLYMVVDSSGKVGIKTTPSKELDVNGEVQVQDLTNLGRYIVTSDDSGVLGGGAWLCFGINGTGQMAHVMMRYSQTASDDVTIVQNAYCAAIPGLSTCTCQKLFQ